MKSGRAVILFGATGLTGSLCLQMLLESNDFEKVIAVTRSQTETTHPKLDVLVAQPEEWPNLEFGLAGYSVFVISCLGTTIKKARSRAAFRKVDFDYVLNVGKLAKRLHAHQLLTVSSIGADRNSVFFYSQVKGEAEDALIKLDLPGLKIFRPSLLTGNRQEKRLGEELATIAMALVDPLLTGNWKKYRSVAAKLVAAAILKKAIENKPGLEIIESDQIEPLGDNTATT